MSVAGGGTLKTAGPFDNLGVGSGTTGSLSVLGAGSRWLSGGQVASAGTGQLMSGTVTAAGGVSFGSGISAFGSLNIRPERTFTSNGSYTFAGTNAGSWGETMVTGIGSPLVGSAAFFCPSQ